jgi:hypothetical protein
MTEYKRNLHDVTGNTANFLLTKQAEHLVDGHRVKVAVVGSAPKGVAVAIAILFKVGGVIDLLQRANLSHCFPIILLRDHLAFYRTSDDTCTADELTGIPL